MMNFVLEMMNFAFKCDEVCINDDADLQPCRRGAADLAPLPARGLYNPPRAIRQVEL